MGFKIRRIKTKIRTFIRVTIEENLRKKIVVVLKIKIGFKTKMKDKCNHV